MKESDFQKQLLNSLREQGAWAYKIPDATFAEGARFIPEKPADIIGKHKGFPFLIECKMLKGIRRVKKNLFQSSKDKREDRPFEEWNQVKSLTKFETTGGSGESFVFINFRNKKGEKRYNRLIYFRWSYLKQVISDGSISKKDMEDILDIMDIKGFKQRYNLSSFLKYLELKSNDKTE